MGRLLVCVLVLLGCGGATSNAPPESDAGDGAVDARSGQPDCNFALGEVIYDGGCVPGNDLMCGPTRMRCPRGTFCATVGDDNGTSFRCLAD